MVILHFLGVPVHHSYAYSIDTLNDYLSPCKSVEIVDHHNVSTFCFFDDENNLRYFNRIEPVNKNMVTMNCDFLEILNDIHSKVSVDILEIKELTKILLRRIGLEFKYFMVDRNRVNVLFPYFKSEYLLKKQKSEHIEI